MKRILSFIVVCAMLVSTLVVMNVGATEPQSWSLPMNWTNTGTFDDNGWELAVIGPWKLTSFEDLSDITTIRNGASSAPLGSGVNDKSPKSFIETATNRAAASAITVPADWSGWYVNYQNRWYGSSLGSNRSVAIAKGDNSTYMIVTPMGTDTTNNPAVVFTAPAAGKYDYSSAVTAAVFTDENDAAIGVKATVRVNGTVVETFVPTESAPSKTLAGTVDLAEGDLLMFAFELTTTGNDIKDYTEVIKLGATTVTEAAAGGDDTDAPEITEWDLPTDWRETDVKNADGWELPIKGNWELRSYNDADGNPEDIFKAAPIGANNTATSTGSPQPFLAGFKYSAGMSSTGWYLNHGAKWSEVGGAIKGASYGGKDVVSPNVHNGPVAVAFTAPVAGTYNFKEALVVTNYQSSNGTTIAIGALVLKYSNGEVTVLDSFVSSTTAASEDTLTGSVELAAGDQILFAFYNPLDTAPTFVNNQATENGYYGCYITECNVSLQPDEDDSGNTGDDSGNTGDDDQGNTNPDTSDNLVLAVSALALAAAGVVIASKKRR